MRIKYFGGNKENGTGRLAVISFNNNEWDLYDFIANYENTYGDETRKFNGRVFVDERDENGVTINKAYIDVDDFDDFNDFKANYKEAKKEFNSLKKQVTEKTETTNFERAESEEIKKFKAKTAINSLYGITSATKTEDILTEDQFHRLCKTLIKSLFKAIGIQDTRKISFTIANDIVFFNYKGRQYKYYPSQCKIFKKRGRKYQRINWKNFGEENNQEGQKQNRGRSPPFTPDIRSINIDKFKIKE